MATLPLANTFEGGTNGTTISVGNSGGTSGDAFTIVSVGSTGTLTYDNAQSMHGTYSAKVTSDASWTGTSGASWSVSPGSSTLYTRFYIRTAAAPACASNLIIANTAMALGSAGKFIIARNNEADIVSGTYTYLANTWYRIESESIISATVGQITMKVYLGDSSTPVDTIQTPATWNVAAASVVSIGFGFVWTPRAATIWFDDIGASITGWLGPTGTQVSSSDTVTNTESITDRSFADTDTQSFKDTTKKGSFPVWVAKVLPGINESVATQVTKSYSSSYIVNEIVTSEYSSTYDVLPSTTPVTTSYPSTWVTQATVTQSYISTYLTLETVTKGYSASFDVLTPVTTSYSSTYSIEAPLEQVTKSYTSTFDILTPVTASYTSTYSTSQLITQTYSSTYSVNQTIQTSYHSTFAVYVTGELLKIYSSTYNILQQITASYSSTYNTLTPVSASYNSSYLINALIVKSYLSTYLTLQSILKTYNSTYITLQQVTYHITSGSGFPILLDPIINGTTWNSYVIILSKPVFIVTPEHPTPVTTHPRPTATTTKAETIAATITQPQRPVSVSVRAGVTGRLSE